MVIRGVFTSLILIGLLTLPSVSAQVEAIVNQEQTDIYGNAIFSFSKDFDGALAKGNVLTHTAHIEGKTAWFEVDTSHELEIEWTDYQNTYEGTPEDSTVTFTTRVTECVSDRAVISIHLINATYDTLVGEEVVLITEYERMDNSDCDTTFLDTIADNWLPITAVLVTTIIFAWSYRAYQKQSFPGVPRSKRN